MASVLLSADLGAQTARLFGEFLTDGADLLGQLLAHERDLLADVLAGGDLVDHLALDRLDHARRLLVGEAGFLQAPDRLSRVHLAPLSARPVMQHDSARRRQQTSGRGPTGRERASAGSASAPAHPARTRT
jgi:hypothetical protein